MIFLLPSSTTLVLAPNCIQRCRNAAFCVGGSSLREIREFCAVFLKTLMIRRFSFLPAPAKLCCPTEGILRGGRTSFSGWSDGSFRHSKRLLPQRRRAPSARQPTARPSLPVPRRLSSMPGTIRQRALEGDFCLSKKITWIGRLTTRGTTQGQQGFVGFDRFVFQKKSV